MSVGNQKVGESERDADGAEQQRSGKNSPVAVYLLSAGDERIGVNSIGEVDRELCLQANSTRTHENQ